MSRARPEPATSVPAGRGAPLEGCRPARGCVMPRFAQCLACLYKLNVRSDYWICPSMGYFGRSSNGHLDCKDGRGRSPACLATRRHTPSRATGPTYGHISDRQELTSRSVPHRRARMSTVAPVAPPPSPHLSRQSHSRITGRMSAPLGAPILPVIPSRPTYTDKPGANPRPPRARETTRARETARAGETRWARRTRQIGATGSSGGRVRGGQRAGTHR